MRKRAIRQVCNGCGAEVHFDLFTDEIISIKEKEQIIVLTTIYTDFWNCCI